MKARLLQKGHNILHPLETLFASDIQNKNGADSFPKLVMEPPCELIVNRISYISKEKFIVPKFSPVIR